MSALHYEYKHETKCFAWRATLTADATKEKSTETRNTDSDTHARC